MDGLEVYKNAFETVAGILCGTGMQIVHEMIISAKTSNDSQFMITEEDKFVVATLLLSILKLLVDLVVSEGATTTFITELKRRLTYELAIAHSFKAETNLYLSFNVIHSLVTLFIVWHHPKSYEGPLGSLLSNPRPPH